LGRFRTCPYVGVFKKTICPIGHLVYRNGRFGTCPYGGVVKKPSAFMSYSIKNATKPLLRKQMTSIIFLIQANV